MKREKTSRNVVNKHFANRHKKLCNFACQRIAIFLQRKLIAFKLFSTTFYYHFFYAETHILECVVKVNKVVVLKEK